MLDGVLQSNVQDMRQVEQIEEQASHIEKPLVIRRSERGKKPPV